MSLGWASMPVRHVRHSGPEAHRELAKKSLEDREILGQDCGINPGIRRALRLIRGVGGTWGRLSESDPTWAANGVARHRTRRGSTWVDYVRSKGHVTGTGVTWDFRGGGRTTWRGKSRGDGWDRYTHNHRPRLFEGGYVHAVQRDGRHSRSGKTVCHLRIPPLRPPQESHLRQGPSLHLQLLTRDVQSARYQAEHLDGLPSTDGWPKQEDESIPGAVPTLVLWDSPEGLGSMATTGPVYPELLAKCVDKENPLQTNFGLYPTGTPTRTRYHGPRYRHPHTIDQGCKRASTKHPQANARKHDQRNKV